jgi:hypothetical protein
VATYRIDRPDTQVLSLPADASVTLTASATFTPKPQKRHPRNADPRNLSVVLALQTESGSAK